MYKNPKMLTNISITLSFPETFLKVAPGLIFFHHSYRWNAMSCDSSVRTKRVVMFLLQDLRRTLIVSLILYFWSEAHLYAFLLIQFLMVSSNFIL